jgi:hypothetical protein
MTAYIHGTYLVRSPDYHGDDEGSPVEASFPDDAAEKYAAENDCEHDYRFQDGDGIVLEVTHPDGKVSHWRTWGERDVVYRSLEVDEQGAKV